MRIKDAKPLLAITAILAPWEVFAFGQSVGWGIYWTFGRVVVTTDRTQFLAPWQLLAVLADFQGGPRIGLFAWLLASLVVLVTAGFVVYRRVDRGTTTRREDRAVGAAFAGAAALFVVSRFFIYDVLLVGQRSDLYWFSVPLGALWIAFVGLVFHRDLFRLGSG